MKKSCYISLMNRSCRDRAEPTRTAASNILMLSSFIEPATYLGLPSVTSYLASTSSLFLWPFLKTLKR